MKNNLCSSGTEVIGIIRNANHFFFEVSAVVSVVSLDSVLSDLFCSVSEAATVSDVVVGSGVGSGVGVGVGVGSAVVVDSVSEAGSSTNTNVL